MEKIKARILGSINFFSENRDNIIRRVRFACRANKARIRTHSEYLTFNAHPRRKWLRERT